MAKGLPALRLPPTAPIDMADFKLRCELRGHSEDASLAAPAAPWALALPPDLQQPLIALPDRPLRHRCAPWPSRPRAPC